MILVGDIYNVYFIKVNSLGILLCNNYSHFHPFPVFKWTSYLRVLFFLTALDLLAEFCILLYSLVLISFYHQVPPPPQHNTHPESPPGCSFHKFLAIILSAAPVMRVDSNWVNGNFFLSFFFLSSHSTILHGGALELCS